MLAGLMLACEHDPKITQKYDAMGQKWLFVGAYSCLEILGVASYLFDSIRLCTYQRVIWPPATPEGL